MPDYITLVGAEAVQSAGHTIRSAAEEMKSASYNMDCSLVANQRFLNDWLDRFAALIEKMSGPILIEEPKQTIIKDPESNRGPQTGF